MIDIRVDSKQEGTSWIAQVIVNESDEQTRHTVKVPMTDYDRLTSGKVKVDQLIEESFLFLLEKERKEKILGRFEIMTIASLFPDYATKVKTRLGIS